MSEKVNIVKVDAHGIVTETKVIEILNGININPGDTITEKGNYIIVERKNYLCDIYLKDRKDDTITEIIKNFELNDHQTWENQRIMYYSYDVVFLHGAHWDNKLINLSTGKVIAEEKEGSLFYGVKEVVSPIQEFGDDLYILKYSLATPKDIYGAEQYILIDKHGNEILPSNFIGRHKKIKSAYGLGNVLLLHYIDTHKNKYGMISVQIIKKKGAPIDQREYIVKQFIKRRYDDELHVNYQTFVKDITGNMHYPCITGTYEDDTEKDITHCYNITGQRIKVL